MSIQDERELRGRLSGLLADIEPAPAPVASAMRRGNVIRMRRWVSAAAGVAVLAAGAVVLPGLIRGHHAVAPVESRHYKVTADVLGPTAKHGVIGAGKINNKRWKIVIDDTLGSGCQTLPFELICGPKYTTPVKPREINIGGATDGRTQFQYGPVGSDVTRVVFRLSNGAELDVRPVSAAGYRWIAVAAPVHALVEAESFVGGSEHQYQYAVPYVAPLYSEFVTWLQPGQPGLPRAFAHLGSGKVDGAAWSISVSIGPWGYCVAFADGGTCIPTASRPPLPHIGKPLQQRTCTTLFQGLSSKQVASACFMVLPAGVKNVVLRFADGSRMRLVATLVGGARTIGYGVPNRPKVVRVLEFGFRGQLVGSVSGADWSC
jgi:hypothetical protein